MSDTFSRIWTEFDAGRMLPACAWCGRVWIDEAWLLPAPGVLAAIDQRNMFSHTICDVCAQSYAPESTTGSSTPVALELGDAGPVRAIQQSRSLLTFSPRPAARGSSPRPA